jgi:pyruvate/2-oxoglutarate/acetoin dehydrogenase E1 component
LGESEILHSGTDITLITYGSSVRIAQEAIQLLDQSGIQVELIDLQTLIPLDLNGCVPQSLKKPAACVF